MKQMKVLSVLTIALALGLTACGGGNDSQKKHKHEYGDWQTVTAATCETGGQEKRICKNSDGKCTKIEDTRDTDPLGHVFAEGDADVKTDVVAATCEENGSYKHTCTRCNQPVTETVPALNHDWEDAEDQTGAVAPTCTEAGTKIQTCKNGCGKTQTVTVAALEHDFDEGTDLPIPDATEPNTKGEVPYHWAKITNYSCKRGDSFRYAWSAKEVNFNYKDVPEGQEPELLDEGDGIRFWGRPIGNAMALSSEGRASSNDDVKIPDPNVKGSRFEFDFIFDTDLTDVCLSAELEPAQYTNDIFKNRSGDQEWTPGYKNIEIDQPGEKYTQEEIDAAVEGDDAYGKTTDDWKVAPTYKGDIIQGMRYIIYLDGVEVPLDGSVNTAPNGKRLYQFPCKLNLTAGKHNLNIAMAGGYLHTFYNFSFEKVPPQHVHNFGDTASETLSGEGLTSVGVFNCLKGDATALRWDAKEYDTTLSNEIEAAASDGSIRFNKAQGKDGETDKGGHLVYKIKSPAAVQNAQLAFYIQAHNQNVAIFDAVAGDSGAGKDVDADGKYTVTATKRYALYVNDVRVELGEDPGKSTAKDWFTFPASFNLNAGENKIEIVSLGGYRAKMYNFQVVYANA